MNITRDEAAAALSDIDATTGRLSQQRSYHISGPILMLWGVVWLVCYSAMGLLPPEQWGWTWLIGDALGIVGTIMLSSKACAPWQGVAGRGMGWRSLLAGLAIAAFIGATLSIFGVQDPNAFMTFPGIVCGAVYFIVGLLHRPRFLVIGTAVFVASLIGFFGFPDILPFWMAIVGGGGLLIGGLWMRSA
ncbi:MAG: hypothetical protein EON87_16400 [Brevundimonas sp.]|nr:MAG: hypothetical protein EON87_16400 [Brevundimonas sp.]